jgi:hypothetical protein
MNTKEQTNPGQRLSYKYQSHRRQMGHVVIRHSSLLVAPHNLFS